MFVFSFRNGGCCIILGGGGCFEREKCIEEWTTSATVESSITYGGIFVLDRPLPIQFNLLKKNRLIYCFVRSLNGVWML